jgi:hypothetical protein
MRNGYWNVWIQVLTCLICLLMRSDIDRLTILPGQLVDLRANIISYEIGHTQYGQLSTDRARCVCVCVCVCVCGGGGSRTQFQHGWRGVGSSVERGANVITVLQVSQMECLSGHILITKRLVPWNVPCTFTLLAPVKCYGRLKVSSWSLNNSLALVAEPEDSNRQIRARHWPVPSTSHTHNLFSLRSSSFSKTSPQFSTYLLLHD